MSKTFKIIGNDLSDGYHTFDELYEHRVVLYLSLCMKQRDKVFYKKDYDEWFCIYIETDHGQVSYHVPNKFLDLAEKNFKHSPDHKWDGHTSAQVLERLLAQAISEGSSE